MLSFYHDLQQLAVAIVLVLLGQADHHHHQLVHGDCGGEVGHHFLQVCIHRSEESIVVLHVVNVILFFHLCHDYNGMMTQDTILLMLKAYNLA